MCYEKLYKSGLSIPQVSEKTGIPKSTLRFRLKKLGILRSRAEGVRKAGKDGRLGSGLRGKKRKFTWEWKKKISDARKGTGKGYSIKPTGYIEITSGEHKGRLQHVVIIEEHIGRRIYAHECVHHVNGIRHDNRLENLKLMTKSDHARHHGIENSKKRKRDKGGKFL